MLGHVDEDDSADADVDVDKNMWQTSCMVVSWVATRSFTLVGCLWGLFFFSWDKHKCPKKLETNKAKLETFGGGGVVSSAP